MAINAAPSFQLSAFSLFLLNQTVEFKQKPRCKTDAPGQEFDVLPGANSSSERRGPHQHNQLLAES